MDLRKLKKLIDLVQESGIGEIEITEGEEKVKIVKGGRAVPEVVAMLPAPTRLWYCKWPRGVNKAATYWPLRRQ